MKSAFAAFVILTCFAPCAAAAQVVTAPQCAKHQQLVGYLAKKYSENPVAIGTVNENRYMQLFVSPQGSWTILVTRTDGQACIIAAGENWEKTPALGKAEPAA